MSSFIELVWVKVERYAFEIFTKLCKRVILQEQEKQLGFIESVHEF